MNTFNTSLAGIVVGIALFGTAVAQETTAPRTATAPLENPQSAAPSSQPEGKTLRIAPGSVIPVELTRSIDAKKAKPGDEIEARVTQDLKGENSEVVIPRNTKVIGHITEAEGRSKEQKESQIGIAFGHVGMKNGPDVSLSMMVQAIIAPLNANRENAYAGNETGGQTVSPSSPGAMGGNSNGRSEMGPAATPQSLGPTTTGGDVSTTQTGTNPRQTITANTQGVVGLANLNLSAGNTTQGSVISSDKSNVKLESGTLMLLKVNP
jgi:hypothetical protein